jgi:hypothetical protein
MSFSILEYTNFTDGKKGAISPYCNPSAQGAKENRV